MSTIIHIDIWHLNKHPSFREFSPLYGAYHDGTATSGANSCHPSRRHCHRKPAWAGGCDTHGRVTQVMSYHHCNPHNVDSINHVSYFIFSGSSFPPPWKPKAARGPRCYRNWSASLRSCRWTTCSSTCWTRATLLPPTCAPSPPSSVRWPCCSPVWSPASTRRRGLPYRCACSLAGVRCWASLFWCLSLNGGRTRCMHSSQRTVVMDLSVHRLCWPILTRSCSRYRCRSVSLHLRAWGLP